MGEGVEDEARQTRREHGVARRDPVDGLQELRARNRLGHVAAGAGPNDVDHVLGRVGDRQGQEAHLGMLGQDAAQDGVAAAARQVHIEQDDVGQALADELHRRPRLVGLPHHFDGVAQFGLDAGPEDRVVLDQEDAGAPLGLGVHVIRARGGMESCTSAPSPGAERMTAVPPKRAMRARMDWAIPWRPSGTASGSNPRPGRARRA